MRRTLALFSALLPVAAHAAGSLDVTIQGLEDGHIPAAHAYCVPDGPKSKDGGPNASPEIHWSKGPEGTKSYAVIVVDPDVPLDLSQAGKDGVTIAADAPRQAFYHWAVVDIPATRHALKAGEGKPPQKLGNAGVTDFVAFMNMEPTPATLATHTGYDGPCPPWNDARMHHYHFQVYALNVENVALPDHFTGKDAVKAITPHVLAQGEAIGTYTLNPALRK